MKQLLHKTEINSVKDNDKIDDKKEQLISS